MAVRGGGRSTGFTLVEVIIALALVSLIMLGLLSAMRTFGQTAVAVDASVARHGDARLVSDFLRHALARACSAPRQQGEGAGLSHFVGGTDELAWIGVMPARHGAGGLYHFRLALHADGGPPFLGLQYIPYRGPDAAPEWSQVSPHVLVERAQGLRLSYQSRPAELAVAPRWVDRWQDEERLPGRVRIDVLAHGQPWAPLIVAIDAAGGGRSIPRIVHGPVE